MGCGYGTAALPTSDRESAGRRARRRRRGRRRRRRAARRARGGRGRAGRSSSSPESRYRDGQLPGPGRARRGDRPRRLPGPSRRGHAQRRARPLLPAAVEVLVEESPAAVESLMRRGVELRPRSRTASSRSGSRAVTRPAGSSMPGGSRDRARADQPARRARRRARADRGARGASALALWSDGGRCHGVLTDRGPIPARGDRAGHRRRRRALGAHHEPARSDRRRRDPRPRRRRGARRPRALPVPPDRARASGPAARRVADHRGGPRRGGAPARRRRAPVHGRARAARPGHRGDPRPDGCRRDRRRRARPAAGADWSGSRRSPGRSSRSGIDAGTGPVPVAPAAHYLIGGVHTDLDGPNARCPGCSPSAKPHARGCTGPTVSPPTRSANASCSAAAPRGPRSTARRRTARRRPRRRTPLPGSDRGEPQRRLGAAGPLRDPERLAAAEVRPLSARPADRRLRARPRANPAASTGASTTLASTRPWTCSTTSSGPTSRCGSTAGRPRRPDSADPGLTHA